MSEWWVWLPAAEAVWIACMALWILFERRSPASTIAWILALGFLPVLGIVIYLLFGPRRFRRKRLLHKAAHQVASRALHADGHRDDIAGSVAQLVVQSESALGPAASLRRAQLQLYTDGREHFAALAAAIAAATDHVHLEYYIWEADQIGTRLRDLLTERASAGVEVRVLVDGIGSGQAGTRFWQPLRRAGGHVAHFNPLSLRRLRPQHANFRTHRKIAVIDGIIGFTGGINITDDQSSEFRGDQAWRDTHIKLEGTGVRGLQLVFAEDWYFTTSEELEASHYPETVDKSSSLIQVISSGPDETIDAIHKLYVATIASATGRVLLTTPYFVPDVSLLDALVIAARRGVEVQIMVPAKNDHSFVAAASRSYYGELLEVGVRLFEYGATMLHAKTLVIDDQIAIVGTANVDARSFRLNFEVVVAAYDAKACQQLANQFVLDREQCHEVTHQAVLEQGLWPRLGQNFARLFSAQL